ncbi:hypothetical protein CIHG_01580 [Coccidioides immitis H538.4]|uniref:Uncharacterized protein n=3 Tax=Coccidioides immitis TaxID=5501 RepID=A0A0J8QVS3_COCIT|nr:hypothetical protein CIRG_01430 [Coccidioides immitis RMSCC 2394]KMU75423.1 hypothetical protein CISG_05059 [Coccidioides immitis RMSCC 3703]KMU83797.1 hypothetical protein CIHG_01580 [Coccidioides immitis H538.4]
MGAVFVARRPGVPTVPLHGGGGAANRKRENGGGTGDGTHHEPANGLAKLVGCRGKGMAEHSGALRTKSTVLGVDGINTEYGVHIMGLCSEKKTHRLVLEHPTWLPDQKRNEERVIILHLI